MRWDSVFRDCWDGSWRAGFESPRTDAGYAVEFQIADLLTTEGTGGTEEEHLMTTLQDSRSGASEKIWVTLRGLPLTIQLKWPFHQSTSGADFWVLHGDIRLEGSEGLHAPVAVNLSQTVREVMPSLEPQDAEAPVVNADRKS